MFFNTSEGALDYEYYDNENITEDQSNFTISTYQFSQREIFHKKDEQSNTEKNEALVVGVSEENNDDNKILPKELIHSTKGKNNYLKTPLTYFELFGFDTFSNARLRIPQQFNKILLG